jgi:large subunit ribosomal protein L25
MGTHQLINAVPRDLNQSESLSQLRRKAHIPGVVFARGMNPSKTIMLEAKQVIAILATGERVLDMMIDGKKEMVNLTEVQREPKTGRPVHLSFHLLKAGEKTHASIPVHLVGKAIGEKTGGMTQQVLKEIEISALPKDLPEFIEVDVSGLDVGDHLELKDVKLPKGVEIYNMKPETNVVACKTAGKAAAADEEAAPAAATEEK